MTQLEKDKSLQSSFDLPPDEHLVEDYSCFYDASLLQPAHLYVTYRHLCVYIHGQKVKRAFPWSDVASIQKKNTAKLIPNALLITLSSGESFFFSFMNRHNVYKTMERLWKNQPDEHDVSLEAVSQRLAKKSQTPSAESSPARTPKQISPNTSNKSEKTEKVDKAKDKVKEKEPQKNVSESASASANGSEEKVEENEEDAVQIERTVAIQSTFDFGMELGRGAFSTVKLVTRKKDSKKMAVKIIDKELVGKDKKQMLDREVDILRRIRHKNIVSIQEIYETPRHLYLVMEVATGGELFDSIVARGKYSEKDAAQIVAQVASALKFLHSKGIVHRDLKPENLLLESKEPGAAVKIADFGLSRMMETSAVMSTACGTPGYVAPEVLRGGGYKEAVDIWSLGVITYILLCGYPPFYAQNNQKLFEKIMNGDYKFPERHWSRVSEEAKDLIRHMLVVDPKKRYTSDEVLSHPWVQGHAHDEALDTIEELVKTTREQKSGDAIWASTDSASRLYSAAVQGI